MKNTIKLFLMVLFASVLMPTLYADTTLEYVSLYGVSNVALGESPDDTLFEGAKSYTSGVTLISQTITESATGKCLSTISGACTDNAITTFVESSYPNTAYTNKVVFSLSEGYTLATDAQVMVNGYSATPVKNGDNYEATVNVYSYDPYSGYPKVEENDTRIKLDKIEVTNVTTDFTVGDEVKFTAKTSAGVKSIVERWYTDSSENYKTVSSNPDDSMPDEMKLTKFEKGVYNYSLVLTIDLENYVYTKNTKLYINGKEVKFSGENQNIYANGSELDLTNVYVTATDSADKNDKKTSTEVSKIVKDIVDGKTADKIEGVDETTYGKIVTALAANQTLTSDLTTTVKEEKDLDEKVVSAYKEKMSTTYKVLAYYDINLTIKADDVELGKVTKLEEGVEITLNTTDFINSLPKIDENQVRKFKVIRIHNVDGVETADIIENVTLNEDGTLSFVTDRFSTYIPVYEVVNTNKSPATGDSLLSMLFTLLFSLTGIVLTAKLNKEN